jgi:hypothetical protein
MRDVCISGEAIEPREFLGIEGFLVVIVAAVGH